MKHSRPILLLAAMLILVGLAGILCLPACCSSKSAKVYPKGQTREVIAFDGPDGHRDHVILRRGEK